MGDVLEGSPRRLLTHLSHPWGSSRVKERIQISKHDSLRKKIIVSSLILWYDVNRSSSIGDVFWRMIITSAACFNYLFNSIIPGRWR